MEPPHGSRAEAERWLVIAEKLLAGRDLVGSRSFAIRARESDPTLDAADQILAVAETLVAGERRIGNLYDWYAILQLPHQTCDLGLIATHYRQLAILLNPHRNRLPFADEAFKLVYDAWSVLLNPTEKSMYDNELTLFSKYGPGAMGRGQEYHQHQQQQQQLEQQQQRQEQEQQQLHQQQQQLQQQQHDLRRNPNDVIGPEHEEQHHVPPQQQRQQQVQPQPDSRPSPKSSNANKESNVTVESELPNTQDENPTFWTACPYCYNMYEYPRVYEDCSLRCQNCQSAFHGAKITPPSPIVEAQESYFCCWGFFPLGVSMSNLEKNKGGVPNWTPFSPMFTRPKFVDKKQKKRGNFQKGPWIYIDDDDDASLDISEPSEESDEDWGHRRKKKKSKKMKGKGSSGKYATRSHGLREKKVRGVSGEDLQDGPVMQEAVGAPSVPNAETTRKVAANSAKKQTGKVPKEWGKLDLNVEFSNNEVEEPAPGMGERNKAGHGEEDGIEGIGFFEGLDEFLSSLPILKT